MNLEPLTTSPALQTAGWALLHSLWQGAVAVLLLLLVLTALPGAGARTRYAAHLLVLGSLLVLPSATGIWLYTRLTTAAAADAGEVGSAPLLPPPLAGLPAAVEGVAAWLTLHGSGLAAALGLVVCLWAAGVVGLALWWTASWAYAHRRVARGAAAAPAHWQDRLRSLQARLGIRAPVRLLESAQVPVPSVVGWRRPVVLVPAGLLRSIDARQGELLLLHELVHVRRRDYAVNLLQLAAEILLFFHPAARWLSRRARAEREHCCDDEVVRLCGEPRSYARALAAAEELRWRPNALAVAVAGSEGSLLRRVQRLVLPPPAPAPAWRGGVYAAACLLAVSLLGAWSPSLLRTAERAALAAVPGATATRVEVQAIDPAGEFTLTLVGGRARGATLEGVPVPAHRIVQRQDSVQLLGTAGEPILAVRVLPEGGITWEPRSPRPAPSRSPDPLHP